MKEFKNERQEIKFEKIQDMEINLDVEGQNKYPCYSRCYGTPEGAWLTFF